MKMRRAVFILPFAAFIALCGLAYVILTETGSGGRNPESIGHTLAGQPMPEITLPLFDAEGTITPAIDLKGRGYAVNAFASWCAPCRLEAPAIELIAEDIPVIGINYRDKPEDARAFLAEYGNPFHAIGVDGDGKAGINLGVHGLPETFIVDAQGIIILHHKGPILGADMRGAIGEAVRKVKGE